MRSLRSPDTTLFLLHSLEVRTSPHCHRLQSPNSPSTIAVSKATGNTFPSLFSSSISASSVLYFKPPSSIIKLKALPFHLSLFGCSVSCEPPLAIGGHFHFLLCFFHQTLLFLHLCLLTMVCAGTGSSSGGATSGPTTSSGGSGNAPLAKVKCKFCEKEFTGGAYRMKPHLSQTSQSLAKMCPDDVKMEMLQIVSSSQARLLKKTAIVISVDEDMIQLATGKRKANEEIIEDNKVLLKRGPAQTTINTKLERMNEILDDEVDGPEDEDAFMDPFNHDDYVLNLLN